MNTRTKYCLLFLCVSTVTFTVAGGVKPARAQITHPSIDSAGYSGNYTYGYLLYSTPYLEFTVIDSDGSSPYYQFFYNSTLFRQGTWTSGVKVRMTWSLTEIPVGRYNMSLFVGDGLGNITKWTYELEVYEEPSVPGYSDGLIVSCILISTIILALSSWKKRGR